MQLALYPPFAVRTVRIWSMGVRVRAISYALLNDVIRYEVRYESPGAADAVGIGVTIAPLVLIHCGASRMRVGD